MNEAEALLTEALRCSHCGDALAGLKVVRREVGGRAQSFCCLGCAFIAEQLVAAQSGTPYAPSPLRSALDTAIENNPAAPARMREAEYAIDGMVCAACAQLIEHTLRRKAGVGTAHVDYATARAYVAFDARQITRADIEDAIGAAGYSAAALQANGTAAAPAPEQHGDPQKTTQKAINARRVELLRVLLAWLMMMQVMMLAVPAYVAAPGDISPDVMALLRIAQLVLTVPVLLFSAAPLYRAALSQLRVRAIGMDLPVVLGLSAAFVASAVATFSGGGANSGSVYFDSITMFVALLLGTRWLQARWLARARRHVDAARHGARLTAQRLSAFPTTLVGERVSAEQLQVDDHVLVAAGETVPADGVIAQGASSLSNAWLTGEAAPCTVAAGDAVFAGSVNLEQPLVVRVLRSGAATSLAALRRLVHEAGRSRPRIVELASRAAVIFLWSVLLITAATIIGWSYIDPAQALPNAIAVLVATCPCALSLAAPAAFTAFQSALAEHGVLTVRAAALERLASVDTLVCDKTGTLTLDTPVLSRIVSLRSDAPRRWLAQAAALESLTNHPFARALVAQARAADLPLPALSDGVVAAAAGVEATIDGVRVRIGRPEFALGLVTYDATAVVDAIEDAVQSYLAEDSAEAATTARNTLAEANSVALLADAMGARALFIFGERLRAGSAALLQEAHAQGVTVTIASGDRRAAVQRLAARLGLDEETQTLACQTPDSKRRYVAQLQAHGHRVVMLGDGINDAPVIAQADVSIALAGGSSLAQTQADLIVVHAELDAVAYALRGARRCLRIVRQNLGWSLAYNVLMIPLAAFGAVTPAVAAVGMAASSALVLANAWRARRVQ